MSFNISFPPNPSDGMIYEIIPGTFYQYNKGTNCWVRLDGYSAIGPATPVDDGLMEAVDFKKLNELIIPPPVIKLKPGQCSITLDEGIIELKSIDKFLEIDTSLDLISADGSKVDVDWNIVKSVYGIDFTIDINELLSEITKRGNLTARQRSGEQGDKGDTGDPGIDRLDTGPVGETGEAGKNAEFAGILTDDPVPIERVGDKNLAIVDVKAVESEKEGKLIVTRANVGNPQACPNEVIPENVQSPWMVAMDNAPESLTFTKESSADCKYTCKVCIRLRFLYIDPIIQAIDQRFQELVYELKRQKEDIVRAWMTKMVELFNQQKAAICCALENYTTRKRNAAARERIEEMSISAARDDLKLVMDGTLEKSTRENFDALDKTCLSQTGATSYNDPEQCRTCAVEFTLNGKVNINPDVAVSGELAAGCYTAQITNCCINKALNTGRYTGRVAVRFSEPATRVNPMPQNTLYFPDLGEYDNNADAASAYVGLTLTFNHAGGEIKMWVDDMFGDDNTGEVIVCIKKAVCFETPSEIILTSDHALEDIINVYVDETLPDNQLGGGLPYIGSLDAIANYSYGRERGGGSLCNAADPDCDEAGPNLTFGPTMARNELFVFFYDGLGGMSLFIVMNKKNEDRQKTINVQASIEGNTIPVNVIVENDTGELSKLSNKFTGEWTYGDTLTTVHGKGGAIGYLDQVQPAWEIQIKFLDVGYMQRIKFASSDGSVVTLARTDYDDTELENLPAGTAGIGTSLAERTYIFRHSGPGCFMPASQVSWYIRGLRIESCCAAIVEYGGAPWAVIKRSIGPDGTCGGGENESTECLRVFREKRGHPSIAWPVLLPSREGIGVPTSGYVEFVEDMSLENQFKELIQSGDVIYSFGPLSEHEVIIFPRIF